MSFTYVHKVTWGDCDMQRIVWNPNYFAFCDNGVDVWVREALAPELTAIGPTAQFSDLGFDFMLKAVNMTWSAPARYGDVFSIDMSATRWGNTSFDIAMVGRVEDQICIEGTFIYVSTDPETARPAPIPDFFKHAMLREITQ
jgi:acyl-CoA thioester hydrolase